MNILLSHQTNHEFINYANDLPQALLIVAPEGSGKKELAINLANNVSNTKKQDINVIEPALDKKNISIDQIRNIKLATNLTKTSKNIIVIPNANLMSLEAQNSILKLLEEPSPSTHFILTVNHKNLLIETILSRVMIWNITNPTKQQIVDYYSNKYSNNEIKKAILLSDCRMGLLSAIIKNNNHPLLNFIDTSKELLLESKFDRMCRIDNMVKNPDQIYDLLDSLSLICLAATESSASGNISKIKPWFNRLKIISESQNELHYGISPKLILGKLFIML